MKNIFFFNINSLAILIANKSITKKEEGIYYLISLIIVTLQIQYYMWIGTNGGALFWLEGFAILLTTVLGFHLCWKNSQKNKFVTSMVCLSVPATIRTFVFSGISGVALFYLFDYSNNYKCSNECIFFYKLSSQLLFIAFNVYFWFILNKGIKLIRSTKYSKIQTETAD